MRTINLTEAKNQLSRLVKLAREGERIRILVHGVPAADLVPPAPIADLDQEAHLADLERRGIIRRGTGRIPEELFKPGPDLGGKPLSEYVLEERRSGR